MPSGAVDHAEIGRYYGILSSSGGVNPGDRRALYYLMAALKPRSVLEIGTHICASTVHMASALTRVAPDAQVTTIDIIDVNAPTAPWSDHKLAMCPRDLLTSLGCRQVSFVVSAAAPFMRASKKQWDLIFLDGDHASTSVYEELSAALDILNPGGVILLHDFYPRCEPLFPDGVVQFGPAVALERVSRENPSIEARSLGPLPWTTKQGSHATSLAIVTRRETVN